MPIDILMPQLSPTMTEGRLAGWSKAAGDNVSAGDVIAEVETDKATMEVEATDDGILHKILMEPGADVPVGTPIAILAEAGEEVAADYEPTSQAAPAAENDAESQNDSAPDAEKVAVDSAPAELAPTLAPPPAPVVAAPVVAVAAPAQSSGGRVVASPLARKIAEDKGLDLARIAGSGPNGRITKKDVEAALVNGVPGSGGLFSSVQPARQGDRVEKITPMRKAIATRLTQSKQHVPHFYLQTSVQVDALMDMRQQLNAMGDGQFKVSVNDLIIKASALALAEYPAANASWNNDSIVEYGNVDVSVAVAIEGGLITPLVFNADQKSVVQISQEMKQLAKDARAGALKPEQYTGGGFSISNLGMYGIDTFSAIVNPPQAAILAVGKAKKVPVVQADGSIGIAQELQLTLSADHRVVDGALGAELLGAIQRNLQEPLRLVV